MIFRALIAFCVVALGLAFHSRNHQFVTIDFYLKALEIPLSWAMVGALVVGALCGVLALVPRLVMLQAALRRERRKATLVNPASPPNAV